MTHAIPADDLGAETAASTSLENLDNSRELLGAGALLVVTDDLHAHRTKWLARRLGLDACVASVEVRTGRFTYGLRELAILVVYQLGFVR